MLLWGNSPSAHIGPHCVGLAHLPYELFCICFLVLPPAGPCDGSLPAAKPLRPTLQTCHRHVCLTLRWRFSSWTRNDGIFFLASGAPQGGAALAPYITLHVHRARHETVQRLRRMKCLCMWAVPAYALSSYGRAAASGAWASLLCSCRAKGPDGMVPSGPFYAVCALYLIGSPASFLALISFRASR